MGREEKHEHDFQAELTWLAWVAELEWECMVVLWLFECIGGMVILGHVRCLEFVEFEGLWAF